jgi:hypothetical protein
MRIRLALALGCLASVAQASPTIPLDDPVYDELAILRAQGRLLIYAGGIRPLTEWDAQRLLQLAGAAPNASLQSLSAHGLWFTPARRVSVMLGLTRDEERPYSTMQRPEQMIGGLEVSCEHQEGRPCGQGGGGMVMLDSAAGYGHWVSAFTRLELTAGSNQWSVLGRVDRMYLNGEYGPVALEIGRDVLALGPGVHTQLIWGDNTAPFDHVRIQTAHPLKIPKLGVKVTALYAFGLLRDPQTFHDTQVQLARLAIAVVDQLELGAQQLLQLNGDGAVHYGFGDFIAENFTRTGGQAGAGGSNRRDSIDAVYTIKQARGLRIYYELAFEDFRKQLGDMLRYDCDHLGGIELPALTSSGRHGFVVELQHNGVVSQSHSYFTTGLTNDGRVVGAPLGPDSWSLYATARLDLPRRISVWPWFEWAQMSSDHYALMVHGPIVRTSTGPSESRERLGLRGRILLSRGIRIDAQALYEHVDTFSFVPGATRNNADVTATFVWMPRL